MKKVYVIVELAKDNPNENWRFLENDVPGSLKVFTTYLHAKEIVTTMALDFKYLGWRKYVFSQVENVRLWVELVLEKKHIALVIIEKELCV